MTKTPNIGMKGGGNMPLRVRKGGTCIG